MPYFLIIRALLPMNHQDTWEHCCTWYVWSIKTHNLSVHPVPHSSHRVCSFDGKDCTHLISFGNFHPFLHSKFLKHGTQTFLTFHFHLKTYWVVHACKLNFLFIFKVFLILFQSLPAWRNISKCSSQSMKPGEFPKPITSPETAIFWSCREACCTFEMQCLPNHHFSLL